MKKFSLFTKNKKRKRKPNNWSKTVRKILFGDTVYKKFFRIYFLTIFLGACFLYLPFSLNPGWVYENNNYVWYQNGQVFQTYSFFDSIFFASSAFSVTGLTVKVTSYIFSIPGQFILLLLIQTGGLGLLAIIVLLWQFLTFNTNSRKFTFEQRSLIHSERGNNKSGQSYKMIYFAFIVIIIFELILWFSLSFFFYYVKPEVPLNEANVIKPEFFHYDASIYYQNAGLSVWAGFFHAISALNNAGFDILGQNSIEAYHTGVGNILSFFLLIGLIIGGIGYPIFYDLYEWIKAKQKKEFHRISLFTKISLLSYLIVAIVGFVLILLFELITPGDMQILGTTNLPIDLNSTKPIYGWSNNPSGDKIWNVIFITFSSRSAGFAGLPMSQLSIESRWLVSALMFIGASPASTGGGIRTVTLFLIGLHLYTRAMGRKYVSIFKKSIHRNIVNESLITLILGLILVFVSMILITSTTSLPLDTVNVSFEVVSAFGTAGLTTGVTAQSSLAGLIALIILMFIGQLGVGVTLLSWKKKYPHKEMLRYQYEDLRVN